MKRKAVSLTFTFDDGKSVTLTPDEIMDSKRKHMPLWWSLICITSLSLLEAMAESKLR